MQYYTGPIRKSVKSVGSKNILSKINLLSNVKFSMYLVFYTRTRLLMTLCHNINCLFLSSNKLKFVYTKPKSTLSSKISKEMVKIETCLHFARMTPICWTWSSKILNYVSSSFNADLLSELANNKMWNKENS